MPCYTQHGATCMQASSALPQPAGRPVMPCYTLTCRQTIGTELSLTNCTFESNQAAMQGGAVYLEQSYGSATLQGVTFVSNQAMASSGGAIYTVNA